MYLIYKQDFYKDKQKEIDEIFIEYLVVIMVDLNHYVFIEEWKNLDADAYEKNLKQDLKLLSIKKKIDHNDKTKYWIKSIKESLNWLPFF